MAQYGIELYADTGLKFIIPDYSGFVFHSYADVTLAPKTWNNEIFHTLYMPAGAQGIAFYKIIGRGGDTRGLVPTIAYQHVGNQLNFSYIFYHPSLNPWDTVTIRMYFFTNKETKPDDAAYGLRVFDELGNVVFHTASKPLRLQTANWGFQDGWSIDVGHGVACMCNRLGQRGQPQQQPFPQTHVINIIPMGEGTILRASLSYQQTVPALVDANRNTDPELHYINTNYYE